MKSKPKYKKGDRCCFTGIIEFGGKRTIQVFDTKFYITEISYWNKEGRVWFYNIKGKENPCDETWLIPFDNQKIGEVIKEL